MFLYAYVTSNESDHYSWYGVRGNTEDDCVAIVRTLHQHDDEIEPDVEIMSLDEALEINPDLPTEHRMPLTGQLVLLAYGT